VLAIAGSDSSGGAGIQADLKTITMLGGYGMTALTAATAQNSTGVQAIAPMGGEIVFQQIRSCVTDIGVDAVKIGMLHDEEVIAAVVEGIALIDEKVPVVLDPVMVATSGAALVTQDAIETMQSALFSRASLITPNLPELALLTDTKPRTGEEMGEAAGRLSEKFGCFVLAKGGHTEDARVIDVLIGPNARAAAFDHPRLDSRHTHGTGCTLSSAIATLLGHGQSIEHAVRLGRKFVLEAMKVAPGYGAGNGPLGHQAVRRLD